MNRMALGVIALAMLAAPLAAQSQPYKGSGYAFWGIEKLRGESIGEATSFGGGAEGVVWKGLGIGADLGYLGAWKYLDDGIGILCVNGNYSFGDLKNPPKVIPFVTAGYALGFRYGTGNMINYGGGMTYWFSSRVGFRAELRNFHWKGEYLDTSIRFGVSFR